MEKSLKEGIYTILYHDALLKGLNLHRGQESTSIFKIFFCPWGGVLAWYNIKLSKLNLPEYPIFKKTKQNKPLGLYWIRQHSLPGNPGDK